MRPADYFYNYGEEINELLKVFLGDGKDVLNADETEAVFLKESMSLKKIRMYKMIVAIQILQEEKMCTIGKMCPKKQEEYPKYTQLCRELKNGIDMLDPSMENRVFYEKVEAKKKDCLYFQEYIRKEINTFNFFDDFFEFCVNYGIIQKKQIA